MIEHSPITKVQLRPLVATEHSLNQNGLGILLRNYLISCQVEDKADITIKTYGLRIGELIRFLGPVDITQISANHVRQFLLTLHQRNLAASSINATYRAIATFFRWLIAEGVMKDSPMQNIKPPRLPKLMPKPFTPQDIANMLCLCVKGIFFNVRNRALILLLLDTGLRLHEVANIKLNEVDFNRETITILGKGSKERVVRMGKRTQKALLRYLLMRTDNHDALWVTESRKPMSLGGMKINLRRLCAKAGIKEATPGPHTFRHTAAINYLRNGGGEFTLQIMLGHSTLTMTRRYVSTLGTEDMIKAHRMASPVDNMKL